MKKIFAIIISTLYLALTVGATVNFHYCGGKLSSVKVFATSHKCCCASVAKEEMNNCCDDETLLVQLNEDQNQPTEFNIQLLSTTTLVAINNNYQAIELHELKNELIHHNLPPPVKIPIYLSNTALTYYG